MTTQRWPSLSSLAMCTAAAMAVPELPPVTVKTKCFLHGNQENLTFQLLLSVCGFVSGPPYRTAGPPL